MELIDIGANLTHRAFESDLPAVLQRAGDVGVNQIVVTGTTIAGSEQARALALSQPGQLYATAGVHPHHAGELDPDRLSRLATLLACDSVVAVGETGLDYFRELSPRPVQSEAFELQLQLAVDHQLPLFLHQREANADFVAILKNWRSQLAAVVVHCFTDNRQALFSCLDLDLYIGITGWICDERRGLPLQSLVAEIPANRLLIETDSPYLTPRDLVGGVKRNEPANLPHIAAKVARCRGESLDTLATATTANARAFFGFGD
jgi:TatD DNase family protein